MPADRLRAQPGARRDRGPLPRRQALFERQRRKSREPKMGEERVRRQAVNPRDPGQP